MQIAVYLFFLGGSFTVESLRSKQEATLGVNWSGTNRNIYFIVTTALFTLITISLLIWYGVYAYSILFLDLKRIVERVSSPSLARVFEAAPDPEISYVDIDLKPPIYPYTHDSK